MNSCATAIHEEFLKALADNIGPQRYKVWFTNLAQVSLSDSTVKVTAPNSFVANWIQKHYANLLLRLAGEVVDHRCRLSVQVSDQCAQVTPKKSKETRKSSSAPAKRNVARQRSSTSQTDLLRFSLDDFVVGPSNQLAFATAQSVVGEERVPFNPLFIHGSCGLGKTHLLPGICNAIRTSQPRSRCIYIS